MRTRMLGVVAALICISFPMHGEASPLNAQRQEIVVSSSRINDRGNVYAMPIRLDEKAILAAIDTGSSGVRVLQRPLDWASPETGAANEYKLTSGTLLKGDIVPMRLELGTMSGTIPAQQITAVGCAADVRECPARQIPPDVFGIMGYGRPGKGYDAMIGINMTPSHGPSPLVGIGAHAWILSLRSSLGQPGRLILNPRLDERRNFRFFRLRPEFSGMPGDVHDSISGCLRNEVSHSIVCGILLFDTDVLGASVQGDFPPGMDWPVATWQLSPGATFPADMAKDHSVELSIPPGVSRKIVRHGPIIIVVGGINGHDYDLLYDEDAQAVGFRCAAPQERRC